MNSDASSQTSKCPTLGGSLIIKAAAAADVELHLALTGLKVVRFLCNYLADAVTSKARVHDEEGPSPFGGECPSTMVGAPLQL